MLCVCVVKFAYVVRGVWSMGCGCMVCVVCCVGLRVLCVVCVVCVVCVLCGIACGVL